MGHINDRNSGIFDAAAAVLERIDIATEGPWYYAHIRYEKRLMGLMIGTDDEDVARREAEEVCDSFDGKAVLLSVTRVVLQ
jgi:hypothetical protein